MTAANRTLEQHFTALHENGFCVLREHFPKSLVAACRDAFWPILLDYLARHRETPNRGPQRHFLPMPFDFGCFAPDFFFDCRILAILKGALDDRIVADQWGCDVPLLGSEYQSAHADYQRPLFAEAPELPLPGYILLVSFGLVDLTIEHGPIEIAPGTHRMPRREAFRSVESGAISLQPVPMEIGDVLIRHPWALHRGSPNLTSTPRVLATLRYVRRWYADASREVNSIPRAIWQALTPEQQSMLRFPIAD